MTSRLQRLLVAPELVVVHLTASSLRALRLALCVEHPQLEHDLTPTHQDPPVRRRARALVRRADAMLRALQQYRRHVNRTLRQPDSDLPF